MPHIHLFLQQLDALYHAGDIDQYEQYWQTACQHAEHFFPGFTIAYAELYNLSDNMFLMNNSLKVTGNYRLRCTT